VSIAHGFSKVWLIPNIKKEFETICVWDAACDVVDSKRIGPAGDIYPAMHLGFCSTKTFTDEDEKVKVKVNVRNIDERVLLQPLDDRYQVVCEGNFNADFPDLVARIVK
jgi:hypothetical protein